MNKHIRKLFLFSGTNTRKEHLQVYWDETRETNIHSSTSKEIKFTKTGNLLAINKLRKEFALINEQILK
jgi:hypothetical protein